jgi:hypothetical protein
MYFLMVFTAFDAFFVLGADVLNGMVYILSSSAIQSPL